MSRANLLALAFVSLLAMVVIVGERGPRPSEAVLRAALIRAEAATQAQAPTGAEAASASGAGPAHATAPRSPLDTAAPPAPSATTGDVPVVTPTAASAPTRTAPAEQPPPAPSKAEPKPSKVGHVFVLAVAGPGVDRTFAADAPAPFLASLRPAGTLVDNFSPLDRNVMTNVLAFAGGQPPNRATRAECATYADFPPSAKPDAQGVVHGDGCVLPNTVLSLADQVTASGRAWKGYVQDLGAGGATSCRHPDVGAADDTMRGRPGDQYATRLNPFVYFHSLLDLGDCQASDVPLDALAADLRSVKTTPQLAYVAPGLCDAGLEDPCADGSPGGLAATDRFLATWVPRIRSSPAFKRDGLLVVAFLAQTPGSDPDAPPDAAPARTGLLLLSRYAKRGTTIDAPFDPYGLLRSVEDLFALEPLAKAADAASFAKTALPGAFPTGRSGG